MKYKLEGNGLFADGRAILFPGGNRDVKAIAELVRRANAYEGLLEACKAALACLDDICVDNGPTAKTLRSAISSAEGGAK